MILRPAAILVFVRAPERGRVKTRLAASIGDDAALRIYRRLAEHVLGEVRTLSHLARIRVHYTPAPAGDAVAGWLGAGPEYLPQRGATLGARMERAFHQAFTDGFERVVIVGSDLPGLTARHLQEALALLDAHPAVIGPARDGGYWLLGLRRPAPELFRDVPWSTATVFPETMRRLRALGLRPALLPELADVDEPADLPPDYR